MNASTSGPGDSTVSGLPGTDALSATACSQKNCEETAGRLVVESNRIAEVRPVATGEGTRVQASESGASVTGVRGTRVIGRGRPGIIVRDNDLVGVVGVGQRVCFGLR